MKLLAILILTTLFAISSSKQRQKLTPFVPVSCPLIPIPKYSQTILFDFDTNIDLRIKTCILKNNISGQSVLLINNYDTGTQMNLTNRKIMTNEYPNVIIMTKYLSLKVAQSGRSPLLELFMKKNWSLLYIIVTDDSKFTCKNGTMNSKDFLLLENIMNTIWHRFQVMRVAMAFPFACKHKMVIYYGKKPSTQNLYDRSIKLININKYKDLLATINYSGTALSEDYPIKADIFYRYPTSIKECKNLHYYVHFNLNLTFGYCGLDGMVMHDLLTHFKFNLSSPANENCNIYGFATPGNISGSLGCIVRNELDISFNSRFMTLYSDEHIYYLHYITTDKLCALVKRTGIVPLWHGAFNVYRPPLWLTIIVVVVIISGIMWGTAIVNKTMTGQKVMAYWYYLLNSVMMTMIGYSPMKTRSMIILRSACLTGSILFMAVYQGHVSRVYTTVKHFSRIKTLDELYTSGATLYTTPGMRQFTRQLQRPGNKVEEEFFNKSCLIPGERIGITLERPLATTLDRKSDAVMKILEHFSDSEGRPLIDIVDECFMTYYLSYITRSGFPFFEGLQIFTQRLLEAGLPPKYYKWTQQMLNIPTSMPESHSEPRPLSKITLRDQRIPFFLLLAGSALSIIVFAAEIWRGHQVL